MSYIRMCMIVFEMPSFAGTKACFGADDGARVSGGDLSRRSLEKRRPSRQARSRTRHIHLGKVALYRMS
ncbi:MAG: hypothetical protein II804_08745, partial [Clostridia bacterium]|nr:hypothetical protein [Clostridia bacterium]